MYQKSLKAFYYLSKHRNDRIKLVLTTKLKMLFSQGFSKIPVNTYSCEIPYRQSASLASHN